MFCSPVIRQRDGNTTSYADLTGKAQSYHIQAFIARPARIPETRIHRARAFTLFLTTRSVPFVSSRLDEPCKKRIITSLRHAPLLQTTIQDIVCKRENRTFCVGQNSVQISFMRSFLFILLFS